MKATSEQCARYKELFEKLNAQKRRAELELARLEVAKNELLAFDRELHLEAPEGHAFDFYGDGELKLLEDCKKPPGVK